MPLLCPFKPTTLEKAAVGELICLPYEYGAPTWAIVWKKENGAVVLAALRSGMPDLDCPTATPFHSSYECASFGTEWVFEIIADATTPDFGGIQFRQPGSGWLVRDEIVALRFGPNHRERQGGMFLNMETFETVNAMSGDGIYGTRWRLWQSAAERDRIGGTPLLDNVVAAVSP